MCKRVLIFFGLLLSGSTLAQDSWTLSGFASLGAGRIQDDNLEFMDYSAERWSFEGDSVIGAQLNWDLADRLSLVTQVVSRGFNWDDTSEFEPELDWFFLRYQLDTHWRTRIGRMRTPLYLYSETLDVGYSYVWARPPIDAYPPLSFPFSNFDGADLVYMGDWGDFGLDIQLLAGKMQRSRDAMEITVDPLLGGNITLQSQTLTFRYALFMMCNDVRTGDIDYITESYRSAATIISALSGTDISGPFNTIAESLNAENNWYLFQSAGLRWSPDRFTATAEMFDMYNTDDQYTLNARGSYLSLQYHLEPVTPYFVAGRYKSEFARDALQALKESYAIWPAHQEFPSIQQQVDDFDLLRQLTADFINADNYTQQTWTLGARYDVRTNVALKAEWQYIDIVKGKGGHLIWTSPDVPDHTSMATLILDVVF